MTKFQPKTSAPLFIILSVNQTNTHNQIKHPDAHQPDTTRSKMKAITLQNGFGIDHLKLVELPAPRPAEDEVLVKLQAVSLNSVDLLVIKVAESNLPLPYVPVADGAGIVEQVGAAVTAFQPGDAVATTFIPDWISGKPTKQAVDYATRQGAGAPGQLSEYKVFKVNQLITGV
jgi:NADPH:quinone reductase-like Zn-dependent oxidoreductase